MALVTFRQIRYFIAVAESGKVSAAAAMLGISPSVVTEAIGELETLSRMKLFQRQPRGLDLTYEGHRFLAHSRNILSAVEGAEPCAVPPRQRDGGHPHARDHHYRRRLFPRAAAVPVSEDFPEHSGPRRGAETAGGRSRPWSPARHDLALMLVSNLSQPPEAAQAIPSFIRCAGFGCRRSIRCLNKEIVTLADVADPALHSARHRRRRGDDRRLLARPRACSRTSSFAPSPSWRSKPHRLSPGRHNPFRHDVSAVVARRQPHRGRVRWRPISPP